MFGLDIFVAGALHLAAADLKCSANKPPTINVLPSDTQIIYDHSKTQRQLDNFQTDTISPYAANVETHVGGLMSGQVQIQQQMQFMKETHPRFNAGCISYHDVTVRIVIKPTIYIAKDYAQDSCMYKAVMEHEKKHIKVDRWIVNKYSQRIGQDLFASMKKIGYTHGPYRLQDLPAAQERLQVLMSNIVDRETDIMNAERRKLQQQVDSLAEYERVSNLCPGNAR